MQKRINIFHNNLDKLHGIDDKLRLQYWKTEILSCEIIEPIVKATVAAYNSIIQSLGYISHFCWAGISKIIWRLQALPRHSRHV